MHLAEKMAARICIVLFACVCIHQCRARKAKLSLAIPASRGDGQGHSKYGTFVSALLVTHKGNLVIADKANRLIFSTLEQHSSTRTIEGVPVPVDMAELPNGCVAVTSKLSPFIDLYNASGVVHFERVRRIHTELNYVRITPGLPGSGTLIVASSWTRQNPATIDVINMEGEVVKTLFRDNRRLTSATAVRRFGERVYTCDAKRGRLFHIDVATGEVGSLLGTLDMSRFILKQPTFFDFDASGTLYLVSTWSGCGGDSLCLARISPGGEVSVMVERTGYSTAIDVTSDGVFIASTSASVNDDGRFRGRVTSYYLPASFEEDSGSGELPGDEETEAEATSTSVVKALERTTSTTPSAATPPAIAHGGVIGIVVALLVALALAVSVCVIVCRRKRGTDTGLKSFVPRARYNEAAHYVDMGAEYIYPQAAGDPAGTDSRLARHGDEDYDYDEVDVTRCTPAAPDNSTQAHQDAGSDTYAALDRGTMNQTAVYERLTPRPTPSAPETGQSE